MTDQLESTPYTIFITSAARKDIRKISQPIRSRIDNRIVELADNPRPAGVKKLVQQDELYRVRVGDYRIIYQINDAVRKVFIARVRHRREAY